MQQLVFFFFAAVTVLGAVGVAFSRNIVYSAFSLLATFSGMVGLFAYLSADFLAVVQLMIYVGGILVLILFAVMLTNRIHDVRRSNPSSHRIIGTLLAAAMLGLLVVAVAGYAWPTHAPAPYTPQAARIGAAFLGGYLIDFEVAGFILLAALIAAVVVARKEIKAADADNATADESGSTP